MAGVAYTQWRRQDYEPVGTACVFTKSDRNHRNLYKNIIICKTELTRYTTACETSSSAVARCLILSVVSFIASVAQYLERSFFIISYFDFKFTSIRSKYNSILFCCLRRNVELCCHTHDSRTTMNVCIARNRAWSISRCTQSRTTVAKCKIQTREQQLLIAKPYIR